METLSIAQAARALSVTTATASGWLRLGLMASAGTGPKSEVLLDARTVRELRDRRQLDARIRHPDLPSFAREVRARLLPEQPAGGTTIDGRWYGVALMDDSGRSVQPNPGGLQALGVLSTDAHAIFGEPALVSAAHQRQAVCRWCLPRLAATVYSTVAPMDSAPFRILLASQPCAACREAWAVQDNAESARRRAQLADLGRRAHQRSSARVASAQAALTAAQREAKAQRTAASRALTAAGARPSAPGSSGWSGEPPRPRPNPNRDLTREEARRLEITRANRAKLRWSAE